jgi:hypothetical protein
MYSAVFRSEHRKTKPRQSVTDAVSRGEHLLLSGMLSEPTAKPNPYTSPLLTVKGESLALFTRKADCSAATEPDEAFDATLGWRV